MPDPTGDNQDLAKKPWLQSSEIQLLFAKLIQEINLKLTSGLDYERVLDFIFDGLGVLIPYDRMGIALVDKRDETVRLVWVRSKIPFRHLSKNYAAPLKGSSLQKIFETGKPRIISDLIQYSAEHPNSESTKLILKDGIRSNLTCPLKAGAKPVGIVFFSSRLPHTYDHNHVDVFLGIADELSVIVEQGKLRNYFSESSSRERTLRMILHDLKSPLNVIQGFLDLTADEEWFQTLGPEGKEVFSVLQRNTRYMMELLSELAELSELNRSDSIVEFEDVALQDFIADISRQGKALCERKDMIFDAVMDPLLPASARFAPQKIRRVLDNLFSNAVKFSEHGTKIIFSVSHTPGRLVFSVTDQGPGIPESEQAKLFKEFGKTSVKPAEGESSSGLGLAIAKKIVEQHRGEITVHSCPGRGSNFTFWIPIAEESTVH
jgi:hypothetical protein